MSRILGISAFYHDSAAALIEDGKLIAAAQEERFTRIKHDATFPRNAIRFVLEEAGIEPAGLDAVAFYDKPLLKFERLLETAHAFVPAGLGSFIKAMPVWIKEKLFIKKILRRELDLPRGLPLLFPEHHLSHAASAFYPSPFDESAILTIDGVGEWATTTIGKGSADGIEVIEEQRFPHSLGLLYSAFAYYLGFKINDGEYKVMGLAPYGDPVEAKRFSAMIREQLVDARADGSLALNMAYFRFASGLTMTHDRRWEQLFGVRRRTPESPIVPAHSHLARAIQEVTGEIVCALAKHTADITGSRNLVLAGGVALNCVANSQLAGMRLFEKIWIQPAAGDAGGSLGAALAAHHIWFGAPRIEISRPDGMFGAFLGPSFSEKEVRRAMRRHQTVGREITDFDELAAFVAGQLASGKTIGWFQGRMEFGPRALGNRSILGDPRNPAMQDLINTRIKFREEFRPFAPSALEEDADQYFETDLPSPYMLSVSTVKNIWRVVIESREAHTGIQARLSEKRSLLPAITHVDHSARLQIVKREANPRFWKLLHAFKDLTGIGVLINTSFNVRDEPIVCTPDDAFRCFMNTALDFLVIENYVFDKADQLSTKEEFPRPSQK